MKARKRLTRQESKELTRTRLIEAAETLFIRKGFDDASVEEISEAAGYTRGAFYSNFKDKDEVFLAVIDRRRPRVVRVLDDIFRQIPEPAERLAAVREWFSKQWQFKDFIVLSMEFSRTALRHRSVQKHLAELRRQELQTYSVSVRRLLGAMDGLESDRSEIVAIAMLAVIYGLGSIAMETAPEWEHMYTDAARFAFDRIAAPQISPLE